MHEVFHVLEEWANVEFNEKKVKELEEKYMEKYASKTKAKKKKDRRA